MKLDRAGITFDVRYRGGTRGSWNEPPENAEIEIDDWHVSDWDELAAWFGTGSGSRPFASVQEIADHLMEHGYESMLEDAEKDALDDFDPPDDW